MKRLLSFILIAVVFGLGVPVVNADMEEEHPSNKPLQFPADMGFIPFHYYNEKHEPEGFTIDEMTEIARRLGRPGIEVLNVNWSGIFAGLFAKKYELVLGGVGITHERAESMDFTEPIISLTASPAMRIEDLEKIKSIKDFKGLRIGVNAGSTSDTWATNSKDTYGFQVVRFDKIADAVLALKTRKIEVVIADTPTVTAFAKEDPSRVAPARFTVAIATDWGVLNVEGTGGAFRKGDPYRYEVEKAIEGMKLDGTLQKIVEKWIGKAEPDNYCNIVFPGYGTPGLRAYEPDAYHIPIFAPKK